MKRKIHKQGSTAMVMRICGDQMKPCYDNQTGEKYKFFEVTREILMKGLICIAEEKTPTDKDGMAEATFLDIGDFIVITNKGLYRMSKNDFQSQYSF